MINDSRVFAVHPQNRRLFKRIPLQKRRESKSNCSNWWYLQFDLHAFSEMDFQKEMRGFFMHSVCLPEKVTEHFSGLSDRVLELKRQGGDTWHVGLIGSGGKLILQPGWSSFASANNISQNDLLLFKFMGESKFEVQIFDLTGSEIINDPKSWGGCSYSKEEEGNMCDELNKEIWQNQSYLGGKESRNCLIRGKELCEVRGQEKEAPHEIVINATKQQSQNPRKRLGASDNEVIYNARKGALNAEQERKAKQLTSKVQARITGPSLTSKRGINIPAKFSAEQLPREIQEVVLCRPKKEMTWQVRYYCRKNHQTSEGTLWRKFVLENKLQEGDVCLFEMVKTARQITFVVHISRAI